MLLHFQRTGLTSLYANKFVGLGALGELSFYVVPFSEIDVVAFAGL